MRSDFILIVDASVAQYNFKSKFIIHKNPPKLKTLRNERECKTEAIGDEKAKCSLPAAVQQTQTVSNTDAALRYCTIHMCVALGL